MKSVDERWAQRYTSPTHANGKRVKHNVYAETREEVEMKLAELIERVREEIRLEKEMLKGGHET